MRGIAEEENGTTGCSEEEQQWEPGRWYFQKRHPKTTGQTPTPALSSVCCYGLGSVEWNFLVEYVHLLKARSGMTVVPVAFVLRLFRVLVTLFCPESREMPLFLSGERSGGAQGGQGEGKELSIWSQLSKRSRVDTHARTYGQLLFVTHPLGGGRSLTKHRLRCLPESTLTENGLQVHSHYSPGAKASPYDSTVTGGASVFAYLARNRQVDLIHHLLDLPPVASNKRYGEFKDIFAPEMFMRGTRDISAISKLLAATTVSSSSSCIDTSYCEPPATPRYLWELQFRFFGNRSPTTFGIQALKVVIKACSDASKKDTFELTRTDSSHEGVVSLSSKDELLSARQDSRCGPTAVLTLTDPTPAQALEFFLDACPELTVRGSHGSWFGEVGSEIRRQHGGASPLLLDLATGSEEIRDFLIRRAQREE